MTEREDRQDISEVLVRYATGIDRRDWPLFRTVFTDDCELDYGEIGTWHGVHTGATQGQGRALSLPLAWVGGVDVFPLINVSTCGMSTKCEQKCGCNDRKYVLEHGDPRYRLR